jgi:hypothetical protein
MPTRNELAKIHIAKKELWLSEDLYRDFLYILFGKKSAKDLNPKEVEELLTHFMGLGWQPTGPGHQRAGSKQQANPHAFENLPSQPKKYDDLGDRPGMATPAQLRMIEYLWMTGKGVRIKTPEALSHFLKHYFHLSDLMKIRAAQVTPILGAIRNIACGKG